MGGDFGVVKVTPERGTPQLNFALEHGRADKDVMRASRQQTTIARPCIVSGRGFWSGRLNTLTFLPASAGSGVRFVRADLPNCPSVPALSDFGSGMPLRTRLASGPAVVDMVEHVMSALYGLQIDNVEVHCTESEMPGLDGSSHAYALALSAAGKRVLDAPRKELIVRQPKQFGDEQRFVRIEPLPLHGSIRKLQLEYQLDFGGQSPVPSGNFQWTIFPDQYLEQIAPARTFISWEDAQKLRSQGLGAHVTERDLLVFGEHGPIDNQLRFDDECCRHKLLDLIGDLALAGCDLVGRVIACRSGHQLNAELATWLRNLAQQELECHQHHAA